MSKRTAADVGHWRSQPLQVRRESGSAAIATGSDTSIYEARGVPQPDALSGKHLAHHLSLQVTGWCPLRRTVRGARVNASCAPLTVAATCGLTSQDCVMRFLSTALGAVAAAMGLSAGLPTSGHAQQAEAGPKVGELAPDFTLPGVTRDGPMREAIKLSSYRGNTVVLAFFFKARTRG